MSSKFKTLVYNSTKKDSEHIILIPRIIVDGKERVPEIPRKEVEQDRLKDQNSELLKQIQELKFKLSNSDKTPVCTKCTDHAKFDCADLQAESVKLQQTFTAFEDKISALEAKNVELLKSIQAEKEKSKVETSSIQQMSDFSKKANQEKKDLELRCIKLSKEMSEFEKIIITERDTFAKERQQEPSHFESEISELTSKLTALSSDYQKEQKAKSDLKQKFDTLSDERNILTKKINDLEAANIELPEKVTADVISQSPVDSSTESVCSFKTASSSIHDKNVFKQNCVKPQTVKSNQIRPSNLFYDKSFDGSTNFYVKSLGKNSKKNQMVWRVKGSSDQEKKNDKAYASTSKAKRNSAHKGKSFDNLDMLYSTNHLIRVALKKICCSYCGAHDFVSKNFVNYRYRSYYVTPTRTATNSSGPKYQSVPKAKSRLQAPNV
ncbi:hypothetical protein L6452_02297 [Arctium lappa]|uniref:Uncharacterized protein n=1 Tax=Arctium lappa TaxID=4217 RepID=A0ACB9FJ58_ARCLA|nr:hypothetical protein L6452_02297 [Arctium lappa]